jgi:hypothetical protein
MLKSMLLWNVGDSSQEEKNMAATVKLGVHNQKETDSLCKNEIFL